VTGQPSLTLPMSVAAPPAGLQLIGRPYGDADLLSIGTAVERMLSA
jgi:Asp-tRNA(Asn)/Glu-tRNA(Gln) amidotransferase A subunit family amidase